MGRRKGSKNKKKSKNKKYFGELEEQKFREYIQCPCSVERSHIYKHYLEAPLYKMAESIINKYRYHRNMSIEEQVMDCLGDISQKLMGFDPNYIGANGQKAKAYSYIGTIIKRRELGLRKKEHEKKIEFDSFENNKDVIIQNLDHSYNMNVFNEDITFHEELFYDFINIIHQELDLHVIENHLSPNEVKIANVLIDTFNRWDVIFASEDNEIGKLKVLNHLKEQCGFDSKERAKALKYFKSIYKSRYEERKRRNIY